MEVYVSVIKININFIFIFNKNKIFLLISEDFRLRKIYNLYKNNLINFYFIFFENFQLVKDPLY